MIRKYVVLFFTILYITTTTLPALAQPSDFNDVPKSHWAYPYIMKLRELNMTNGIGNNLFGLGKEMTRGEFVTFLCNLMEWDITKEQKNTFTDNQDPNQWYYSYVETAFAHGVVSANEKNFRPTSAITREEMTMMIVNALGYESLAKQLNSLGTPFQDVSKNQGVITIAKDLGLISGLDEKTFAPTKTATREQVATIMVKLYDTLRNHIQYVNGFYAIQSADQMNYINDLEGISFGWSRLEYGDQNITLNTTTTDGNEYYIPPGFSQPFSLATNKDKMLMISVKGGNATPVMNDDVLRNASVQKIADTIHQGIVMDNTTILFDGVVIDFELLKGEQSKQNFNDFLQRLREQLPDKKIFVAVHPKLPNNQPYYDGYDYPFIGFIADKVILMAHDFNATTLTETEMQQGMMMTPLAPIASVYYALREACNDKTGIGDKNKLMFQLSFDAVQWKSKNNVILNSSAYRPNYDAIVKRIQQGARQNYSTAFESPYITFHNLEDQTDNIVWYENDDSVAAKIKLAKLFGVSNISLWRLGTIPSYGENIALDVWSVILKNK